MQTARAIARTQIDFNIMGAQWVLFLSFIYLFGQPWQTRNPRAVIQKDNEVL